jgi:Na+/proline symporter
MTGMDQEMMQKNISVRTLKDSQKNVLTFGIIQAFVVLLFLFLGGLLYLYAGQNNIEARPDRIFPSIALGEGIPPIISVIFIIALISALFPSADGAITALTSSFCIDILGLKRRTDWGEKRKNGIRKSVHLTFALVFLLFVMVFKWVNSPSMIGVILKVAGYTYGPLLGLFGFGILTNRRVEDRYVPYIAVAAPLICFLFDRYQREIFGTFEIGLEIIIINGLLVFLGLLAISKPQRKEWSMEAEKTEGTTLEYENR